MQCPSPAPCHPPVALALLRCWLPVATAWAMTVAAAADLGCGCPGPVALRVAAGTLAVYSADRIGDPTVPAGAYPALRCATLAGIAAVAWLLPAAGLRTWMVVLAAGALGLLHRWLRRWLPKNVVVGAAWAVVVADAGSPPATALPMPLLGAVALAVWSACLLCDLKDGTLTIARLIGGGGRRWAVLGGLLAATAIACRAGLPATAAAAAGLVPLALAPSLAARPVLGSLLVDGVLAVPGAVVAAVRGLC